MQRVKHQKQRIFRNHSSVPIISMCLVTILFSAYQLSFSNIQSLSDALPIESKLSESLVRLLSSSEDPNFAIDAIAQLTEESDWKTAQQAILQIASKSRIKAYHQLIHAISFQTTVGELENIAGLPYIQKIWTDIQVQLDLPQTTLPATLQPPNGYTHPKDAISANRLYDLGFNGSNTVVAILDTGIDTTHPDLDDMDDNETTNDPKVVAQIAFTEGDPFPFDLNGHGTYCAGLVAGTGFASGGNYSGIAPGAQLMSAKVLLGDGTGYSSWIIRGIEWSITNGADIILLPFSTLGLPGDPLSEAVRTATSQGILVVCAAGDQGPNHLTIMSPGEVLSALTVGAYDTQTGAVPDFSSRGPTFDFRTKPDFIAPGVDIISSSLYNIFPTEIGNFSIDLTPEDLEFLGGGSFGIPINENYTQASTTAASASITAGAACLLLEGNRFATPEAVGISIRKGTKALGLGPNIEGTGLLNTSKAYDELAVLHNPFPTDFRPRSVGIGLPYYGMLISEAPGENVTLLLSGYSTAIGALVLSTITNMSLFHMLFGLFHLAIADSDPIPFTFLDVEQEFHWTDLPYGNYVRATGILSYNDLLIIPRIETWQIASSPSANAFRFSFFLLNIGSKNVTNIRLYSEWNFDLFSGANNTSIQQGFYNTTSHLFHIYGDVLPENETTRVDQYIGINASTPFTGFQVGSFDEVGDNVQNETLSGATTHVSDEGIGFGSQWRLGNLSAGASALNVSMTLGFGRNFTALVHGINHTENSTVLSQLTDLCMIRPTIPRAGTTNSTYQTSVTVLNIGDTGVDSLAAYFTNRSQPQGGAIFARYFQLGIFMPFQFQALEVEWNPEVTDIYFAGWIVSPSIDFDLITPTIPTDRYPLDNLLYRDVFISSPPRLRMFLPTNLPFGPMTLNFPNDYAIYNFTLLTTTPIDALSISIEALYDSSFNFPIDRNISNWETHPEIYPNEITDIVGGTQFQFTIFIPTFIEAGPYFGNIVLSASDGWQFILPFVINVTYPKAVILFDSIHNQGLDFANLEDFDLTDIDFDELLSLFNEIGDSLITGYSRLRELFSAAQLNLVDIPLISEINSTVLQLFDGLVICDPEKGFTPNETLAISEFIESGFKVLVLVDHPGSSNHTALNQLLYNQSIQVGGIVTGSNTTELLPSHPFTVGVNSITTIDGTVLTATGSAQPFAWVNGTPFGTYLNEDSKELLVIGCSAIFGNTHLYRLDNLRFVNQTIHHLFRRTLTLTIRITGGTNDSFYIGNDAGFIIDAHNVTGGGVEGLDMFVVYVLPNRTQTFFIAFEVKEGRYGSFLFANWTGLEETETKPQTFSIIVFTTPGRYASSSIFMHFYYIPPLEEPPPPLEPDYLYFMTIQIFLITLLAILVIGGYFTNQHRRRRRMRTPTLDEQIIQNIDNTLNTTHALIREIEWTLTNRRMDRIEKLRVTSGEPVNRLETMIKRLRELAKETGVK
ncbi:MAG: S8 family serine peptidase [Promethearchaeota archaeon]